MKTQKQIQKIKSEANRECKLSDLPTASMRKLASICIRENGYYGFTDIKTGDKVWVNQ